MTMMTGRVCQTRKYGSRKDICVAVRYSTYLSPVFNKHTVALTVSSRDWMVVMPKRTSNKLTRKFQWHTIKPI